MPLRRTAVTTHRPRTPAIMDRQATAVSIAQAVSWLRCQVAAAVRHRLMRPAMVRTGLMGQAVAPIPAVILADHRAVRLDRVLALNLLVH